MKIALVHDHLIQPGGAERVLLVLARMFPNSPIYTLFYEPETMSDIFPAARIRTSYLQNLPFARRHYQWYLPLMPVATELYDLRGYDLVISSASAFDKGVLIHPGTIHLCYCHTPTRYLWSDTYSYVENLPHSRLTKFTIRPILSLLRGWDMNAASRVDNFVANSQTVAERIRKYYRRESTVIYPPVTINSFSIAPKTDNFYLTGGRLVNYKRFDLTVRAFSRIGLPLKIFGEGPEDANLRALAKKNIEFLGAVSDSVKADLYRRCIAFIHPQVEDFGITAVEAMASGRPVIAYQAGGAKETVLPGVSGVFFEDQEWESLADSIIRFAPEKFDPQKIRTHAEQFSETRFVREMMELIEKLTASGI